MDVITVIQYVCAVLAALCVIEGPRRAILLLVRRCRQRQGRKLAQQYKRDGVRYPNLLAYLHMRNRK